MTLGTIGLAVKACGILTLWLTLSGCATAPLMTSGSLVAYNELTPADGITTKSKLHIDKPSILAARSISIVPARYSAAATTAELSDQQRRIIANAIDRSLCIGLSDRFQIVPFGAPTDLTVSIDDHPSDDHQCRFGRGVQSSVDRAKLYRWRIAGPDPENSSRHGKPVCRSGSDQRQSTTKGGLRLGTWGGFPVEYTKGVCVR